MEWEIHKKKELYDWEKYSKINLWNKKKKKDKDL